MKDLARYKNILLVIVIIVVFFFVIRNMRSAHASQMKKLENDKSKMEENVNLMTQWALVNGKYNDLAKKFLSRDPLSFKRLVEAKANQFNITIDSLRPSHEDKGFYWGANIILNVSATYRDNVRFITALQGKNIAIKSLDMQRSRGAAKESIKMTLGTIIIKGE